MQTFAAGLFPLLPRGREKGGAGGVLRPLPPLFFVYRLLCPFLCTSPQGRRPVLGRSGKGPPCLRGAVPSRALFQGASGGGAAGERVYFARLNTRSASSTLCSTEQGSAGERVVSDVPFMMPLLASTPTPSAAQSETLSLSV